MKINILKQHKEETLTADDIDPDWKGFLKILENIAGDEMNKNRGRRLTDEESREMLNREYDRAAE